jgi:hypothetical protein
VQATQDLHLETQYLSGNNGTVYVYGNLIVKGNTTSIEANDLSISDKVLVLNKGEPGIAGGTAAGVSVDGISGISISRGGPSDPVENANWLYNQNKNWSYNGVLTSGIWEAIIGPPTGGIGTHSGVILNAIRTGSANTDLSLLGAENASAVVTLSGVVNYTQRIVTRSNPDDVPNKGYVDYAIEVQLDRRRLQLNYRNSFGNIVQVPNTFVELTDANVPGYGNPSSILEPQLRTSIGGNQWITAYNNRIVIGDIKILDSNEITMDTQNTTLVLSTRPGVSATLNPSVELKTSLSMVIDTTYLEPNNEAGKVKLYPEQQGPGGTGLYFVNSENVRDELVSKRRSFFASLMF